MNTCIASLPYIETQDSEKVSLDFAQNSNIIDDEATVNYLSGNFILRVLYESILTPSCL